jgi:DNA-binding HxlR family transcriptional regulator
VELTVDVVGGHHLTGEGRSLAPVLQAHYDWGVARAARTGVTF